MQEGIGESGQLLVLSMLTSSSHMRLLAILPLPLPLLLLLLLVLECGAAR
jgi:hypothetical protein